MKNQSINKIIFLSDLHLLEERNRILYGCNTADRLKIIINKILALDNNLNAIILMGDISQDGSILSYHHLLDELKVFSCPIYAVPGNHDSIDNLETAFVNSSVSTVKQFELCGWNFLTLNTVLAGEASGLLTAEELVWLDKKLIELSGKKIILLMHHHPLSISTPLIDKFILKNADQFFQIIKNKPNIHSIIFGHVHNVVEIILNKMVFLSCPSTCFQFIHGTEALNINKEEIGYRWLEIDGDKLLSGVRLFNANL